MWLIDTAVRNTALGSTVGHCTTVLGGTSGGGHPQNRSDIKHILSQLEKLKETLLSHSYVRWRRRMRLMSTNVCTASLGGLAEGWRYCRHI